MDNSSEEYRQKLKEEYKEHYRSIKDAKEKLRTSQYSKNVANALKKIQNEDLLNSVDEFLDKVREKVTHFEARLDVAMDEFGSEDMNDEEIKKQNAKETIRQIKNDMGLLYNDIEEEAEKLQTQKTIGKNRVEKEPSNREEKSDE